MIMDPGERNIATPRGPTQINPALNSPNTKLDEDERAGLQSIRETFESVRSDIATAWNKAMIWIDDEVVFARLNTLLSVAKEAADRVIEAALRAEKNAADTLPLPLSLLPKPAPTAIGAPAPTMPLSGSQLAKFSRS